MTNPKSFNLEREKKNETDGKKADGVIYVNEKVVEIAANSSYVIDLTGLDNIALLAVLAQYNESITSGSNQVVEGNPATVGITFNSNTRNAFGFEAIGLNKSVSTPSVTLVNSHPEAKILIYFAAFCEA